jgi:hypothetical protein
MLLDDEDIFGVVCDRYPADDHEDCPLNDSVPLVRGRALLLRCCTSVATRTVPRTCVCAVLLPRRHSMHFVLQSEGHHTHALVLCVDRLQRRLYLWLHTEILRTHQGPTQCVVEHVGAPCARHFVSLPIRNAVSVFPGVCPSLYPVLLRYCCLKLCLVWRTQTVVPCLRHSNRSGHQISWCDRRTVDFHVRDNAPAASSWFSCASGS